MATKFLDIDERIAKREKVIPKYIQKEVLEILNTNAILYGFYVSTWSERRIIKLLKERYGIKITRYMAKSLLDDRKHYVQENSNKEVNEIDELNRLGYDVFLVYFFKIGLIHKDEVESFIGKKFFNEKLDINLAIAIGKERMYIKIIFSEVSINFKKTSLFDKEIKSLEINEKDVVDNKANFIKEVVNNENSIKNIVFVSKKDRYIERFNKSGGSIFFYIQNMKRDYMLLECYDKRKEVEFINELINKKSREFKSIGEIDKLIYNKVKEHKIKKTINIY